MKVNKAKLEVELEELTEDIAWEDVVEELHDASPRFVAYMCVLCWKNSPSFHEPLINIFFGIGVFLFFLLLVKGRVCVG